MKIHLVKAICSKVNSLLWKAIRKLPADSCKVFHELKTRYPKASDAVKQRAAKEQAKNGCK